MSKLTDFQKAFKTFLLTNNKDQIESFLYDDKATSNIDIHHTTFHESLFQIIKNNFKETEKLLGEEYFEHIAKEYIKTHQDSGLELQKYANDFPIYLEKKGASQYAPYIKEFANFEFIINQILCGKDIIYQEDIEIKNLTAEMLEQASFSLKENIFLLKSSYNIADIWDYCFSDGNKEIDIVNKDCYYLCYKNNKEIIIKNINSDNYKLLCNKRISFLLITEIYEDPTEFFLEYFNLLQTT